MSLQFSDTSTYKGIVQIYEKEISKDRTYISGNADRLKELTADVNLAFDDLVSIAIQSGGTWQFDDSNQTDYPIITTNLVSGQRDYSFVLDGSSNLILDIYKVYVKTSSSGQFVEITPVDVQSETDMQGFYDGNNTGGVPSRYDKTANGIFLDKIPNYNSTGGLKVYINREPSYFVSTDTSKKAGIPGTLHKYLALKPALDYARRNSLASLPRLEAEVAKFEGVNGVGGLIRETFGRRTKDERPKFTTSNDSNK
jgi:hypothetical protein